MMLAWKNAAGLAAGNTMVIKPAQVTQLTALKWAELTIKAGFPPGVVNVIPGSGSKVIRLRIIQISVKQALLVQLIVIMGSCASTVKKVSLGLGGKSPLIIFRL